MTNKLNSVAKGFHDTANNSLSWDDMVAGVGEQTAILTLQTMEEIAQSTSTIISKRKPYSERFANVFNALEALAGQSSATLDYDHDGDADDNETLHNQRQRHDDFLEQDRIDELLEKQSGQQPH